MIAMTDQWPEISIEPQAVARRVLRPPIVFFNRQTSKNYTIIVREGPMLHSDTKKYVRLRYVRHESKNLQITLKYDS